MKTFLYHENGWRMFQAERLPVKPDKFDVKQYMKFCTCKYCQGVRDYESEIAALKAKSIPIGNHEICPQNMSAVKDGQLIEWPGDVEIMMQEMEPIFNGFSYIDVAILTLPKEQQQ